MEQKRTETRLVQVGQVTDPDILACSDGQSIFDIVQFMLVLTLLFADSFLFFILVRSSYF